MLPILWSKISKKIQGSSMQNLQSWTHWKVRSRIKNPTKNSLILWYSYLFCIIICFFYPLFQNVWSNELYDDFFYKKSTVCFYYFQRKYIRFKLTFQSVDVYPHRKPSYLISIWGYCILGWKIPRRFRYFSPTSSQIK